MATPTMTDTLVDDRWESDARITGYSSQHDDVAPGPCPGRGVNRLHEASRKYGNMSMTELCKELSLLITMLYKMKVVQPEVVTLLATAQYRLREGWTNNQAQFLNAVK